MNAYLLFIVSFMILAWGVESYVSLLNLRALHPELPREFSDTFDAASYAKSQEYTRIGSRFGLIASSVELVVLLAFIFLGGFPVVDSIAKSFGFGNIITGLLFFAILSLLDGIVGLPFSIYRTFVIETRYGFNKTTPLTFVMDRLKGMLLGVVIGGPLMAAVLWFFEAAGPAAWLYAWATVTVVSLALQYLMPKYILPLFNSFTPLPEGPLRTAIHDYAESVGFLANDLFMIDGSKRSSKANAFFTGFGKKKRIALFDTLIDKLSTEEIVAVVAHEVGHSACGHILKLFLLSTLRTGATFLLLSLFLNAEGLYQAFGMQSQSIYAGFVFFMLLLHPFSLLISLGTQTLSRRFEFQADAFAARTTQTPGALISGLKKLSVTNLANLTPHPAYVRLHYSHPPLLQRIRAIQGVDV